MDVDHGNIGFPSLLFTGHFSKRLLSVYKETLTKKTLKKKKKKDPQGQDLHLLFFGAGFPVLCVVDIFSNEAYSISQLEDLSLITWKRDE